MPTVVSDRIERSRLIANRTQMRTETVLRYQFKKSQKWYESLSGVIAVAL